MTVDVVPVEVEREERELLAVLERNLPALPHARRFRWLYHDNPAGVAWAWFVYDRPSGRVVGAAALFPRFLWMNGAVHLAGQVGDFAVDDSHRTLGPAVLLQRATFGPVDDGKLMLCYDCPPDDRGMATFHRLGLSPKFHMVRFARLLRLERQVTRRVKLAPLAGPIAAAGNVVLRRLTGRSRGQRRLEITLHAGAFGEEFSALDRRIAGGQGIRQRRAAEDLNWRFRQDPLVHYTVLTARRQGELVGYVVVQTLAEDAWVTDLFGNMNHEEIAELLDAAAQSCTHSPIQTLHAVVAADRSLTDALKRAGFWYRSDGARVVAYAGRDDHLRSRGAWRFTHLDVAA